MDERGAIGSSRKNIALRAKKDVSTSIYTDILHTMQVCERNEHQEVSGSPA